MSDPRPAREAPSLARIAHVFFMIGATSFGGGVVAYLRQALVEREEWFNDDQFLRILELSQTLPGLNSVNMAVLAGDEVRGTRGAAVAGLAMIVPGVIFVMGLGAVYVLYAKDAWMNALLSGAAAAAVGLLLATTFQLGKKQFSKPIDLALVLATAYAVGELRISLMYVVPVVGGIAIWLYRPRRTKSPEGSAS